MGPLQEKALVTTELSLQPSNSIISVWKTTILESLFFKNDLSSTMISPSSNNTIATSTKPIFPKEISYVQNENGKSIVQGTVYTEGCEGGYCFFIMEPKLPVP